MPPTPQSSDSVTIELEKLFLSEQSLTDSLTALQRRKSPGTVIFFDLVGSTGYRHRYKAEAGLQKAHLHNMTVSRAIIAEGGNVIKWIGDAVMGCFDGVHDEFHCVRAIRAALRALKNLKLVNKKSLLRRIANPNVPGGADSDHDIHTKIAICSGLFHYFDLVAWSERPLGATDSSVSSKYLDPMGSSVDLAARMTHLAQPDVILLDEKTFWGHEVDVGEGEKRRITGVTNVGIAVPRWRRLQLDHIRDTVYVPHVAAFFLNESSFTLSSLVQASDGPITVKLLNTLVDQEREDVNRHKNSDVVFVQKPIPCNIPGIDDPVPVLAMTLAPSFSPIKHARHSWPAEEITTLIRNAERAFRRGEARTAESQFLKAVEHDSRNFHAHLRLGMLARAAGDTLKALDHLTRAKESDPDCALAWATAGMVHLDDYVHDNEVADTRESLIRAITGFTRAKKLASAGFQGLLEQYCTCLLAIACFLHKGDKQSLSLGKSLLDELDGWAAKNVVALRLHQLATVFLKILENDPDAKKILDDLLANLGTDNQHAGGAVFTAVPYDHVLNMKDVADLISEAVHRQKVQRPTIAQAKS
jgi:class 3 adenylate cyclase/tetratricopeptide (TPR) repeat protein